MDDNINRIRVVCRLRQLNQLELSEGGLTCLSYTNKEIQIKTGNEKNDFTFDRVFGPESTQSDVYDDIATPILESFMNGYNGTIFAYGQTSSGKTYTMEGPDNVNENTKGLIPRIMYGIFDQINSCEAEKLYFVSVSFLEIYNEKVNDLLDVNKTNLNIKEDRVRGIYVQNLTEESVQSAEQMQEVMTRGSHNRYLKIAKQKRSVAATRMNDRSSRSHSLFCIYIKVKDLKTDSSQVSKLYFVDLAGSEKISKTNVSGQQLEEAKNINKSLTCLGMVINALGDKKEHIPYRDSKLTRILSESIGGNSKTTLVLASSMCSYNEKETLGTLRFGARAKKIKNKPKINMQKSSKELQVLLDIAEIKIQDMEVLIQNMQKSLEEKQQRIQNQMFQNYLFIKRNQDPSCQEDKQYNRNNSIKLLQQYQQLVNLKEEKEQLSAELASKELVFQQKNEEIYGKQLKLRHEYDNLKLQFSENVKKQHKVLLENEILKQQIQDKNTIFHDYQRSMDQIKVDLKYLMMSLQIKQVRNRNYNYFQFPNISDSESTRSIFTSDVDNYEEKAMQNLISFDKKIQKMNDAFSFIDQDITHEFKNQDYCHDFYQKEGQKIAQFESYNNIQQQNSLTLSQIGGKYEDSSMFMMIMESGNISQDLCVEQIKDGSISLQNEQYEDGKDESDLQKVLILIYLDSILGFFTEQDADAENLQSIQQLFHSQRKKINELLQKNQELHYSFKSLEEKHFCQNKQNKLKLIKLKDLYFNKTGEFEFYSKELQRQLEDMTCQYAEFRQSQGQETSNLQNQIKIITSQLDVQQRLIQQNNNSSHDKESPLSREYQFECTIRQMMQERKELYESLQQSRLENETLKKNLQSTQDQVYILEKDFNKLDLKYQESLSENAQMNHIKQLGKESMENETHPKQKQSNNICNKFSNSFSQRQTLNSNAKINDVRAFQPQLRSSSQTYRKQNQLRYQQDRRNLVQFQAAFELDENSVKHSEQFEDISVIDGIGGFIQPQPPESLRQNHQVFKKRIIFGCDSNVDGQLTGISSIIEELNQNADDSYAEDTRDDERVGGKSLISMIKGFFS